MSTDSMCASTFMKLHVRLFSYSYTLSGGLPGICTHCLDTGYYSTIVKTSLLLMINLMVLLQVCKKC